VEGIQFHPESIMTPQGKDLLRNFLQIEQPATASAAGEATAEGAPA
jgi:GMP synthase-like glutamine amidotransferase